MFGRCNATRRLIVISITASLLFMASPVQGSHSDLERLVLENEDSRIDARDLAFLLVTHDFDAMPRGDYVVVKIDGAAYRLTPNGDRPGLADISAG